MNNKKYDVLITGGTGFIGSALSEYLAARGMSVICLDQNITNGRLDDIKKEETIHLVQGSVLHADLVDSLVSQSERVIHLAAVVGVDDYISRGFDVLDVNILGTRNVLLSCLVHNRPVLMASTSEIYGKNTELLNEESDQVYGHSSNTRWCYAISKACGEHYARALQKRGLVFTIVRYFNVYGPRIDAPGQGRVISKFLGAIRDKRPLELVDGGEAIRSFCYIDDAVEATAALALKLGPGTPFCGKAFNIGRFDPISMSELAHLMIQLSGHTYGTRNVPGVSFFGSGFEEIPNRSPDVSYLRKTLGFEASIELEDGLRKTLAYWGLLESHEKITRTDKNTEIIPMVRPYFPIDDGLLEHYRRVLASGNVTNCGQNLKNFEKAAANYLDVPDAVIVSSGADALFLVINTLGLAGKVILPAYTFIATLNAVVLNGLEPIFCDIDPTTYTMCPWSLQKILQQEENVSCIIPVNVFGVPPDLETISETAARANIKIVYDNAHGFGTETHGRRIPQEPLAAVSSFHATKIMPAVEGGIIVSSDPGILKEVRRLRNHGIAPVLTHSTPGMNAKMDEIRAITGLHVLKTFDGVLERRRNYAQRLRECLESFPETFCVQKIPGGVDSNFQNLGVVCLDAETVGLDRIIEAFKSYGVQARSYFNPALHHLSRFEGNFDLPVTDKIFRSLVCLPIHSYMADHHLKQVEQGIRNVSKEFQKQYTSMHLSRANLEIENIGGYR